MRIFNLATRSLAMTLLCLSAGLATAQVQLNREYTRLDAAQPQAVSEQIEVIDFFYGCPVCYELEPNLSRWQVTAPNYVKLTRVPALASENWENLTKLFYALETTGDLAHLHFPIYDNIHFDGVQLNDDKVMLEWVSRNKVDPQKFSEAFSSEGVKVETACKMLADFNVRSIPTLVVDGKFVTSARLAGSTKQISAVLNQLVELARKERGN